MRGSFHGFATFGFPKFLSRLGGLFDLKLLTWQKVVGFVVSTSKIDQVHMVRLYCAE